MSCEVSISCNEHNESRFQIEIIKLQDMTVKKDHMIMDIHQVTLITMDLTEVMVENQLVNGKDWVILLYSLSSVL